MERDNLARAESAGERVRQLESEKAAMEFELRAMRTLVRALLEKNNGRNSLVPPFSKKSPSGSKDDPR